ncbi:lipase family protein [Acidovorax cavernicola]|uniref:Alpha/beta hydrolase n=1 Tax=Acidovorax cavernicola TaxID=1675792 RepID=A0A9X8GWN8_9BURK|nr:lipase family protein [Acidovorax cavernicola]RIX82845.1 alpha/beta hydrolase [Acidovorax cavernicola]
MQLTTCGVLAALGLLSGCSTLTTSPGAPLTAQGPAGLAFYQPPTPLPAGRPGDVIWARPVTNDAALPSAAQNWLVLYRSTNIAGQPVAVSGTVAIPKGAPPANGWPVISWTHGTTGIADICAPSRNDSTFPPRGYVNLMNASLDQWVAKGYAVVQTDYEGLGTPGTHPYLVMDSEARGAVDMVRAARRISPALSRDWLVMGHSQGGGAAAYTGYMGPVYGQELNLKGAVAISPSSHMSLLVQLAQKKPEQPSDPYGTLLFHSVAAAAPGVNLAELLTPTGRQVDSQVDAKCVGDLRNNYKVGEVMNMNADFRALNGALATLMDTQNARPSVPVLVLQADQDEAVPKPITDLLVARYKGLGVAVDYRTYQITDKRGAASNHQATVAYSLPDAMAWAAQHLPSGRP